MISGRHLSLSSTCCMLCACAAGACSVSNIYIAELLPTSCRSSVLGICSQASRVGSIAAPFLLMMGAQAELAGHSQVRHVLGRQQLAALCCLQADLFSWHVTTHTSTRAAPGARPTYLCMLLSIPAGAECPSACDCIFVLIGYGRQNGRGLKVLCCCRAGVHPIHSVWLPGYPEWPAGAAHARDFGGRHAGEG